MKKEYCVYVHVLFDGRMYFGATCQRASRRWRNGEGYRGTSFPREGMDMMKLWYFNQKRRKTYSEMRYT